MSLNITSNIFPNLLNISINSYEVNLWFKLPTYIFLVDDGYASLSKSSYFALEN